MCMIVLFESFGLGLEVEVFDGLAWVRGTSSVLFLELALLVDDHVLVRILHYRKRIWISV